MPPNKRHISDHFCEHEVACRCGCGFMVVVPRVVVAMEIIRGLVSKPVNVNSWCRCLEHNRKEKGSPNSQHLHGLAVDWWVEGMSPEKMYLIAKTISVFNRGGIGVYDSFVHTDARRTGQRRFGPRWSPDLDTL